MFLQQYLLTRQLYYLLLAGTVLYFLTHCINRYLFSSLNKLEVKRNCLPSLTSFLYLHSPFYDIDILSTAVRIALVKRAFFIPRVLLSIT